MIAAYDAECWGGCRGRWADQVSLGVLASSVPRDVIDDVVAACGRQAKRSDGKLPPHVMVYFAIAGKGELIALVTTIADPRAAPAAVLAQAYHQR